jgi:hypothetical protein
VIKLRLLSALARIPLDGGLFVRGRRLFGDNKTLRGAVVMPLATALSSWATTTTLLTLSPTTTQLHLALPLQAPALWGAIVGVGYIVGELPNSFLKRQLDIGPGEAAPAGPWRVVMWLVDQLDFLLGIAVVTALCGQPIPWTLLVMLGAIASVVHPAVAGLMVLLGLKRRVG